MKYCESCPKLHVFCEVHGAVNLRDGGQTPCKDCAELELYDNAPTFAEIEKIAKAYFISRPDVRKSTWQTCQHAALLSLYKHATVIEGGEERAIVPTDKVSVLYSGEVLERYVTSMKGVLQGVTIANTVMRVRSMFGEEYRKCYEKNGIVVKELPRVKVDGSYSSFNGYSDEEWEKLMDLGWKLFQSDDKRYYLIWFFGCKVGLRWSDIVRLKHENIVKRNGRMFVQVKAHKNGFDVCTPIHPDDWRMVSDAIEAVKRMRIHRVSATNTTYILRCNKGGNGEWNDDDRSAGAWLHDNFNKILANEMGWTKGKKTHRLRKMGACRMLATTRDLHSALAWLGDTSYEVAKKSYLQQLALPDSFEGLK